MRQTVILSALGFILMAGQVGAQQVRGAFPSPSIQILPMMVAAERGFYKREGLELELVFVRGATTAVQALLANQIQFIFSIGPQMPAVWEGNDIMLFGPASWAADFFPRGYAGYPENFRSQGQKTGGDLWRLDGGRDESFVGIEQDQSGQGRRIHQSAGQ